MFKKQYSYNNIFHCTVHKAGSQWIRKIFCDPIVQKKTGFMHFQYQNLLEGRFDPRKIDERCFYLPFPDKTFCSPLYLSYENYLNIPKIGKTKAFYIYRDIRALTVSYYFSVRDSHPVMGNINEERNELQHLDINKGLLYVIEYLDNYGYWKALSSWKHQHEILKIDYLDLVESPNKNFLTLFEYLELNLTSIQVNKLIELYSFLNMSNGREIGQDNVSSHLRSGGKGNWEKYWSDEVEDKIQKVVKCYNI